MARPKRKKPNHSSPTASDSRGQPQPSATRSPSRFVGYVCVFLLGAAVTLAVAFGFGAFQVAESAHAAQQPAQAPLPDSHFDLLAMSPEELGKVDLALMNLLCAKGLPGSEELDIPAALARLDEWAAKVKFETERHLYRVTDPQYAEHYNHSEARLRAEFIVQVLQEDCGVHYNEARIHDPDTRNPKDTFIHGMIGSDNGGTCASMPVLYTAVGRRLGYPLKLVTAKRHLLLRWDGDGERFNIEGASNGNVNYYPDDYYLTWPLKITEKDKARGEYLISLTPEQELSIFLHARGDCFRSHRRMAEALPAYSESHRRSPNAFAPFRTMQAIFGVDRVPRMHMPQRMPNYMRAPDDPTPKIPMPGSGPRRP